MTAVMEEQLISKEEFWLTLDTLIELPLDYGETEEDSINKKLVGFITLISQYTSNIEFPSDEEEFEFYYKLTKKLTCINDYDLNIVFCIRKLLSLLDYIVTNDREFVRFYAQDRDAEMDSNSVDHLNNNTNFIKAASFVLLFNYKLNLQVIDILEEFQGFNIMSRVLVDDYNRAKCSQLKRQDAIYKNFMEIMYEFCKNVKMTSEDLKEIDTEFIHFLLDSIRGFTKHEDESNFYKFKIVVILNEQFMVNFYEQHAEGTDQFCENAIFMGLLQNDEFFRNFSDCLILNFNRESDDQILQILILKILYLIFTTSMTCKKFYLNDLRVLIDIFVRELSNLSIFDNQIPLINTYLRVLYPMLLFSQLKDEKYKSKYLIEVSQNLLRELDDEDAFTSTLNEENLEEVPTTKRLVLRLLKHLKYEFLRTDSVSSEISNNSAANINKLSSKSVEPNPQNANSEEFYSLSSSRSSSIVSQVSLMSNNSKKIPPPIPLPRKALNRGDSANELTFTPSSPAVPRRY